MLACGRLRWRSTLPGVLPGTPLARAQSGARRPLQPQNPRRSATLPCKQRPERRSRPCARGLRHEVYRSQATCSSARCRRKRRACQDQLPLCQAATSVLTLTSRPRLRRRRQRRALGRRVWRSKRNTTSVATATMRWSRSERQARCASAERQARCASARTRGRHVAGPRWDSHRLFPTPSHRPLLSRAGSSSRPASSAATAVRMSRSCSCLTRLVR